MKKYLMILSSCIALIMLLGSCSALHNAEPESDKVENIKDDLVYDAYTAYIDASGAEGVSEKIETSKQNNYKNNIKIRSGKKRTTIYVEVLQRQL